MPKRQYDTDEDDMFDERGLLKDKRSVRVPMMMRDSADGLTALQRSVRDATGPLRVVDAFGNGGLALSRPGARYLTAGTCTPDHAALVMRDHQRREARDEYITDLQDAWKNGTNNREVARVHNTGDDRTDAYLDQKHDLENSWHRGSGKRSQDSAPGGPVYDAAEAQRVKDEAYRAMVDELENAWRKPVAAPPSSEPRATTTDAPRTMSLADAQAIRDAAYRQYCDELVNAWKAR
jgi:hypothetical protein